MNLWKEVVRPTKKPRSVVPRKLKPTQTAKKTTNNKKTHQKNMKFKSVTIQIPEYRRNKNKEPRSDNTQGPKKSRSERTQNDPISTISDIQESRTADKDSTPQRMTSVAGHPKNRLYIDSDVSLHILFNKELMGGLQDLDRPLKIQAGGKPIHMSQIGSLHPALQHLPLPVSTYHYSETAIANLLSFAKLADEYYIICNTRVDGTIYVQSKDDSKYL